MKKKMKRLIAYYSRPGNNYVNGEIVNLSVGNTEVAAKMIQKLTDSYIFQIETVKKYPEDYHETTDVAKLELRQNARPELSAHLNNMADYNVVFLGYPNWWGTMPMAVFTFLDSYDFDGKSIIPFCTHEGSEMGHSVRDIGKLCPLAKVLSGLAIRGGCVKNSDGIVREWLKRLDII